MRNPSEEKLLMSKSNQFNDTPQLWNYCLAESLKEGLFLEFGVFEGGSINFMSSTLPNIQFYGFDSFEGLPEFWRDGYDKGVFKVEKDPAVNSNVELITGLFQETLILFLQKRTEKISFCHIDCDLYSSTKYVLQNIVNRLTPGSIILFDEFYNYPGYETGEILAFIEAVNEYHIEYEYLGYNINHEQAAIRIV